MTLPPKGMQDVPNEESSDAGVLIEDREAPKKPSTAPEGIPELDASLVFSEMSRLCEQVLFVNPVYRSDLCCSDLCLFNLSFSWLS